MITRGSYLYYLHWTVWMERLESETWFQMVSKLPCLDKLDEELLHFLFSILTISSRFVKFFYKPISAGKWWRISRWYSKVDVFICEASSVLGGISFHSIPTKSDLTRKISDNFTKPWQSSLQLKKKPQIRLHRTVWFRPHVNQTCSLKFPSSGINKENNFIGVSQPEQEINLTC